MLNALWLPLVGLGLYLVPPSRYQAPAPGSTDALVLARFEAQVIDYEKLIRQVVKTTPAAGKPTPSPDTLQEARRQAATAVREARPHAQRGEFFTPGLTVLLRRRLATALAGAQGARVRASLQRAEPQATVLLPVNSSYPSTLPLQSMPPSLLLVLPALPPDLEYGLVGRDLILHDLAANLVVDVLPAALPAS